MLSFFSYVAAFLVFLGKFRRRWLWLPTVIIGVLLFWVFLTWNRVPSFCDNIEIIPIYHTDGSAITVSIKHPYFTFNSFSDDFCGFWSDYGTSFSGVFFSISNDSVGFHEKPSHTYNNQKFNAEIRELFPLRNLDSIGLKYEFRVRKELFGNMDSRNAHNQLIRAWDDKGFSVVKRTAKYHDNVCVDSIRALAGVNRFWSSNVPVGYRTTMYYTLMRLLRMENISQFNYSLVLSDRASCINRLELDFGGPMEIKGIWPTPDIVEPSRIIYISKDKLSQVKDAGIIKMFCQSLESATVQNVRLFILTTVVSLCFAYTLREFGVFILFCCRWIKKKCSTDKKIIEARFGKTRMSLHNFCKTLGKRISHIWQVTFRCINFQNSCKKFKD